MMATTRVARLPRSQVRSNDPANPARGTPALSSDAPGAAPLRCACGGGCPLCAPARFAQGAGEALQGDERSGLEAHFGRDLSAPRLHRDAAAARSADALGAPAYALGRHIYFGSAAEALSAAGRRRLLAHELAHTLQAEGSAADPVVARSVSQPGDVFEVNADALASGAARSARRAPPGRLLYGPLDDESAGERQRREELLEAIGIATDNLLRLMSSRGLLQGGTEVPVTRGGVQGVIYGQAGTANEEFTSYADRDLRLRRIVRTLIAMGRHFRSAPIPAGHTPPHLTAEGEFETTLPMPADRGGGTSSFSGSTAMWADLQASYARFQESLGRTALEYDADWYYIGTRAAVVPGAAPGAPRLASGTPSGAYMVFPDVDREPLHYWLLDGYTPAPRGSVIIEFWHDDFGYYYTRRGRRIDVPNPWRGGG